MMFKWAPRPTRDQALQLLDPTAAGLISQTLADQLELIPLHETGKMLVLGAFHWSASKCIAFLEAVKQPLSPVLLDPDVFAELRSRLYGE
jgi:hypothetical protein